VAPFYLTRCGRVFKVDYDDKKCWIQVSSAPTSFLNAFLGQSQSKTFLGRSFNWFCANFISSKVTLLKSVFLGKYCLMSPFVFSLVPLKRVLIDPEATNTKAIHVYQKVGFKISHEFIASWHPVPHYQMELLMKDLLPSIGDPNA